MQNWHSCRCNCYANFCFHEIVSWNVWLHWESFGAVWFWLDHPDSIWRGNHQAVLGESDQRYVEQYKVEVYIHIIDAQGPALLWFRNLRNMGIFIKHPMVYMKTVDLCSRQQKLRKLVKPRSSIRKLLLRCPRARIHTQHLQNLQATIRRI